MPWTDFIPDYKDQVAITTTLPSVTCAFTPIGKKFTMYYKQADATSAPGTTTTAQVHLVLQLQLLMLFL